MIRNESTALNTDTAPVPTHWREKISHWKNGAMSKRIQLNAEVLLADLLEQCCREKRSGLLSIVVAQSSLFPLRIYLEKGNVSRFSFGPLVGDECLEFLPYYDLGLADYLDGMRAPREADEQAATGSIIDLVRGMGKTIRMRRWFEREVTHHAKAV